MFHFISGHEKTGVISIKYTYPFINSKLKCLTFLLTEIFHPKKTVNLCQLKTISDLILSKRKNTECYCKFFKIDILRFTMFMNGKKSLIFFKSKTKY